LKRALYILFTVYFVALIFAPCGDKDDCNDNKKSELCQTEHNEHNNESHEDEGCTPFCVCSCCAAHFVPTDLQPSIGQVTTINTIHTILKDAETSSAIIPIWQPPRIA